MSEARPVSSTTNVSFMHRSTTSCLGPWKDLRLWLSWDIIYLSQISLIGNTSGPWWSPWWTTWSRYAKSCRSSPKSKGLFLGVRIRNAINLTFNRSLYDVGFRRRYASFSRSAIKDTCPHLWKYGVVGFVMYLCMYMASTGCIGDLYLQGWCKYMHTVLHGAWWLVYSKARIL